MNRGLGIFLAMAAFAALVAAGFSWKQARDADARARVLSGDLEAAIERLAGLEGRLRALGTAVERGAGERRTLEETIDTLARRLGGSAKVAANPPDGSAGSEADDAVAKAKETPQAQTTRQEFAALLDKVLGRGGATATPEEQQRFWELARTSNLLGELMQDLEAGVEANPEDVETRMDLSRSYVVKLMSVPDGPERGAWALKAEAQWQEVLNREPDHWEAQYSLGFSWGQWPDFLNKAPDAIKAFERAREIQEAADVQPQQADTYLQLSRLYLKQGNAEKSRAVLEGGIKRHPDNGQLTEALAAMGK